MRSTEAEAAVTLYMGCVGTPLGTMWIAATANGTCVVTTPGAVREDALAVATRRQPFVCIHEGGPIVDEAAEQLAAYFAGTRRTFTVPLALGGTPFQRDVWAMVAAIPYGETATYHEIAERIGTPQAARAVGAANGANPAAIVIPCHRIIGSDGSLTGYGGGLARKRALLELEHQVVNGENDISL